MCRCMHCNRTLQEILPTNLSHIDREVPVLYLGCGALPICIRCSTEQSISLMLYGLPIYVYDKKDETFKATEPEFENIRTTSSLDYIHNFALYKEVFKRTEKPKRCHLS